MAGSVLMVDIKAEKVSALVLNLQTQETNSFETPLVVELPGGLKDALGALLQEMESAGVNCDFSQTIVGLSPREASLRVITLPFKESRKVAEVLPFELSDSLIENVEDLVIVSLPLWGERRLAVSVERKVVESALDVFESLGIGVNFVGLSLLYKGRLLSELHGLTGTAALVDSTSIVVIKDSSSVLYSYISDINDLKFTFAVLSAEGCEVESFYASGKARDWLDELGFESEPYNDDNSGTDALLRLYREGASKDPINFRKGPLKDKRERAKTQRSLRLATVLVVLMAVFWSINIYSRFSGATREFAGIEDRLGQAYGELFIGESVVDPFYQMEIKIKEINEERAFVSGGIDVLGTLKGLGEGASSIKGIDSKLKLFEVKMRPERVVARGESKNFDSADRFKDTLLAMPAFSDISLTDVKKNSTSGVNFSIIMKLGDAK